MTDSARRRIQRTCGDSDPKPAEARRLKELEEENRRLKLLVAELTLRNQALKLVVSKKW